MNSTPILTIITPVYNGERFIAETIESVLNANIETTYEYIILDDGSSDSTPSILNNFINADICFKYGNPGNFNRKVFGTFTTLPTPIVFVPP